MSLCLLLPLLLPVVEPNFPIFSSEISRFTRSKACISCACVYISLRYSTPSHDLPPPPLHGPRLSPTASAPPASKGRDRPGSVSVFLRFSIDWKNTIKQLFLSLHRASTGRKCQSEQQEMTSWCKLGEARLVWIPDLADPTQNIPHVEAVNLDVCRIADLVKG